MNSTNVFLDSNPSQQRQHRDRIKHLLPAGAIIVEEINPVLGAHVGPGVLGFACISKK